MAELLEQVVLAVAEMAQLILQQQHLEPQTQVAVVAVVAVLATQVE
jgi:hypothetical protein